jgi:hypothetical protein
MTSESSAGSPTRKEIVSSFGSPSQLTDAEVSQAGASKVSETHNASIVPQWRRENPLAGTFNPVRREARIDTLPCSHRTAPQLAPALPMRPQQMPLQKITVEQRTIMSGQLSDRLLFTRKTILPPRANARFSDGISSWRKERNISGIKSYIYARTHGPACSTNSERNLKNG